MVARYQTILLLPLLLCSSLAAMDTGSSAATPADTQPLALLAHEAAQSALLVLEQLKFEIRLAKEDFEPLERERRPSKPISTLMHPILELKRIHPQPFTSEENQKMFSAAWEDDLEKTAKELHIDVQKALKEDERFFDVAHQAQALWDYDVTYVAELMNGINRYMRKNETFPRHMAMHLAERLTMLLAIVQERPELPNGKKLLSLSKKIATLMPVWRNKEERIHLEKAADELTDITGVYETFLTNQSARK